MRPEYGAMPSAGVRGCRQKWSKRKTSSACSATSRATVTSASTPEPRSGAPVLETVAPWPKSGAFRLSPWLTPLAPLRPFQPMTSPSDAVPTPSIASPSRVRMVASASADSPASDPPRPPRPAACSGRPSMFSCSPSMFSFSTPGRPPTRRAARAAETRRSRRHTPAAALPVQSTVTAALKDFRLNSNPSRSGPSCPPRRRTASITTAGLDGGSGAGSPDPRCCAALRAAPAISSRCTVLRELKEVKAHRSPRETRPAPTQSTATSDEPGASSKVWRWS
mmetsp:Transcript_6152/g.19685  ORF Transcript_6152/g.19685 Transcript_6152/m.19685 type:complete len:279 (-) Transcript_6152:418-1254(-)|eukprot:scaffold9657_cov103-Isochrysis_galbana.AAC.4